MKNSTMVSLLSVSFGAILFILHLLGVMGNNGMGLLIASAIFAALGGVVFVSAIAAHKIRAMRLHEEIESFLSSTDAEPSK